jgi:hypothetical protein
LDCGGLLPLLNCPPFIVLRLKSKAQEDLRTPKRFAQKYLSADMDLSTIESELVSAIFFA